MVNVVLAVTNTPILKVQVLKVLVVGGSGDGRPRVYSRGEIIDVR